jgi:hypothetical protein
MLVSQFPTIRQGFGKWNGLHAVETESRENPAAAGPAAIPALSGLTALPQAAAAAQTLVSDKNVRRGNMDYDPEGRAGNPVCRDSITFYGKRPRDAVPVPDCFDLRAITPNSRKGERGMSIPR